MLQSKACNKCGGDLYWEEEQYSSAWHCIQCGFEQGQIGNLMVREEELDQVPVGSKRSYHRGEQFYKRFPHLRDKDNQPVKAYEFWHGYRQAVLDMSPK